MKNRSWYVSALLGLALVWSQTRGGEPVFPFPPASPPIPDLLLIRMQQPGSTQPGSAQPGTGQPGTGQPGAGQPGANQPGADASAAASNTGQQTANNPAASNDLPAPSTELTNSAPEMLGDLIPYPMLFQRTITTVTSSSSQNSSSSSVSSTSRVVLPAMSDFKVADNQSARPLDRVYFSFNGYNNFYNNVNQSLGSGISNVRIYQETFGFEKTFLDGEASVQLSMPLNTFQADNNIPGLNGNATNVGDLSVILKGVLVRSADWNRLISGGVAVTLPSGPRSFAGDGFNSYHNTTFQPFVGYLYNCDKFYIQGFSEIAVPTDGNNVTLWFNDIGIGYYLYCSPDPSRFLTRVAPTLEAHVNTPLNHQGFGNFNDPVGIPNIVDFTAAVNFDFAQRARLAIGGAIPATGPTPYNGELLVQFRYLF